MPADKKAMTVLICGGRDFSDYNFFCEVMDRFRQGKIIGTIVRGNAQGTDKMAKRYARLNHITQIRYPAEWRLYGKAAGPKRNQQMLDEEQIDVMIAFPGGTGTMDMIGRARKAGVPVYLAAEEKVEYATNSSRYG